MDMYWSPRIMAAIGGGVMLYGFVTSDFDWTLWLPSLALVYFAALLEGDRQKQVRERQRKN